MRLTIALKLRSFLIMALVIAGCSNESSVEETAANTGADRLSENLKEYNEQIRRAPGRTGILAEEKRYSLLDEELIIRDFFQDRKGGFFLDVGCAWPIRASNTYYLEEKLGWTGIGVDALEDYAEEWGRKRPGSKFFAFLVSDRTGGSSTFFKSPNIGLSSTNRVRASGKDYGDPMEPEEIEVSTIALDDLLKREGVEKIDLLSMDIEGHEPKALAGFDIDRFQPELVVIEGKSRAVANYLQEHGYEQIQRYVPFDPINRYFRRKQPSVPSSQASPGD